MKGEEVVIVGAGHAGAQCAIALRQEGFEGTVIVVGDEPERPYERPPLSKEYLAGEKLFERLLLRPEPFWAEKGIEFRIGQRVTRVDPEARQLEMQDGQLLAYDHLVWAAGGRPRKLGCAGASFRGVHSVRTRVDIDTLRAEIADGARRFVIIGGGYIGLEAAAVLTKLGHSVVLTELLPRVLARVAGEEISAFFETTHRSRGVDLRTGEAVEEILGEQGKVTGVRLRGGETLACDAVIVGIGIVAAVEPLIEAGATGQDGVDVDAFCRTSLPGIFAVGDCAAFECAFAGGERMRVESVQNANDMATNVARSICGKAEAYHALPWFWSHQYDLRLQTVGISRGYDQAVLRGDPATNAFSVIYLKDERIVALDCVNMTKDYVQGRKLVEAGVAVPARDLSNPDIPLKDILLNIARN